MSEKSRLCSTIKDLKDEKRNLQSQINLLSKKSNDVYQELASESDYFYEMMNQLKEKFPVLTDLVLYALKMKKQYDDSTFVFANSIKTSSPKIYNMLIEKLGFPSTYKCDKYTPPINTGIAEYYLDDSRIPEIIQKWKKQNNLKSHDEIQACLSVDALFFTPDIHITYENEVSGMLLNKKDIQKLPLHVSEIFLQNPRLFESFLNFNKNKIIRCAFVFQIQPFRVDLPTFTCHIIPTTSGKSNDDIVKMLINIKNIANNHKIFIKTFAFDGDGAYNELHKQYYKSYFNYTLKNNYIKIVSKSKVYRVVCDMLHLLKRLRYRLLSCIIHPGFRKSKTKIDLDKIKKILNFLPSIVFNNDRITKMNDALPLLLFSPKCFLKLYEQSYSAAVAYWFPITCIILVMTNDKLSFFWQKYLLECAFWFMAFYQQCELKKGNTNFLKQKRYGDENDVRFYSEEQAIELINTLHCQIQMMLLFKQSFCFDRNSSMPLEHKFGQARVRCKDINTLSMFLKSINDIENYSLNENNIPIDILIHCRRNSFGVNVSDSFDEEIDEFSVDDYIPQTIALWFLKQAGFDVSVDPQPNDPTKWFYKLIKCILSNSDSDSTQNKKVKITKKQASSNSLLQKSRCNARSRFLIENQNSFIPTSTSKKRKKSKKKKEKKKIESPYQKFSDMFYEIIHHKPSFDDLQSIYLMIKFNDPDCQEIENLNDSNQLSDWLNLHFDEYETLIFTKINELK